MLAGRLGLGTSCSTNNPKARVLTRGFPSGSSRVAGRRRWTGRARPRPHRAADNARGLRAALPLDTRLLSRPWRVGRDPATARAVPARGRARGGGPARRPCRRWPGCPLRAARTPAGRGAAAPRDPLFQGLPRPDSESAGPGHRPAQRPAEGERGAGTGSHRRGAPSARAACAPAPRRPPPRLSPAAAGAARPRPRRCRRRGGSPRRPIAAPAPHLRRRARSQPAGSRRFLLATSWGGARPCGPGAFVRPRAGGRAVAAARPLPFPPGPAWPSPGLWAAGDPEQPWGRPGRLPPSPLPPASLPTRHRRSGLLGQPVPVHLATGSSPGPSVLKGGLT